MIYNDLRPGYVKTRTLSKSQLKNATSSDLSPAKATNGQGHSLVISFLSFLTCLFILCNSNAKAQLDPNDYTATANSAGVTIAGNSTSGLKATIALETGTNVPIITIAGAGTATVSQLYRTYAWAAYKAAYNITDPAVTDVDANWNLPFKIVITDKLTTLQADFVNMSGLLSFDGSATITTITAGALTGCTGLTELKLASVTATNLPSLPGITSLALKITAIPADLLAKFPNLETAGFGEVTTLEENAFKGKSKLKSITLGAISAIPAGAFQGCSALTTLTGPTGITSVGADAFNGCSSLTALTALTAGTLTALGARAFEDCAELTITSLGFGNLTTVPESAFEGCLKLTTVTMPTALTTIEKNAFKGTGLTTIDLSNVTNVGESAFENCTSLATVTMPAVDGQITLSKRAFAGCTILTEIDLVKATYGKTEVPEGLFDGCTSLVKISGPSSSFPTSVKKIGARAFAGVGFTAAVIPSGIETIGAGAFEGAAQIAKVTIENTTNVVTLENANAFAGLAAGAVIVVPDALVDNYRAAAGWKDLAKTPGVVLTSTSTTSTSFVNFEAQGTCSSAKVEASNGNNYTTGTASLSAGTKITLTATEDDCCEFVNWTNSLGDVIAPTDATTPLVLEVYASDWDITYYANFVPKTVVVAFAGGGGQVNGTNVFSGACGTTIELVATPDSDKYTFLKWMTTSDDGDTWTDGATTATQSVTVATGTQYRALFKVVPSIGNITVKNSGKVSVGKQD